MFRSISSQLFSSKANFAGVPQFAGKRKKKKNPAPPNPTLRNDTYERIKNHPDIEEAIRHGPKAVKRTAQQKEVGRSLIQDIQRTSVQKSSSISAGMRRASKKALSADVNQLANELKLCKAAWKAAHAGQVEHLEEHFKKGLAAKSFLAAHKEDDRNDMPYEELISSLSKLENGPAVLTVITQHVTRQLPEVEFPRNLLDSIDEVALPGRYKKHFGPLASGVISGMSDQDILNFVNEGYHRGRVRSTREELKARYAEIMRQRPIPRQNPTESLSPTRRVTPDHQKTPASEAQTALRYEKTKRLEQALPQLFKNESEIERFLQSQNLANDSGYDGLVRMLSEQKQGSKLIKIITKHATALPDTSLDTDQKKQRILLKLFQSINNVAKSNPQKYQERCKELAAEVVSGASEPVLLTFVNTDGYKARCIIPSIQRQLKERYKALSD
jgi:hypothetical protein